MGGAAPNPLIDPGEFFVRLTADNARRFPGLLAAVQGFDAGELDAGRAATEWLHNVDVAAIQESVVHLCFTDGDLVGFYALASGQVELSQRQRTKLAVGGRPTQPAVILTWIAKDARHEFDGIRLVDDAVYEALKASEHVAATVLALDPFDAATADLWRERYGFINSAGSGPGRDLPRMVIPLRKPA